MTFGFDRDIDARVVTSTVSIKEWGTGGVDESKEKENLNDYPQILNYADIDFTGKFKMNGHTPIYIDELTEDSEESLAEKEDSSADGDGVTGDNTDDTTNSGDSTEDTSGESSTDDPEFDVVKLDLGNMSYTVDADFTASYSVDAKKLTRKVKEFSVIPDEDCLAQAMVILWEKKIGAQLTKLITNSRLHMNGFADEVVEITV